MIGYALALALPDSDVSPSPAMLAKFASYPSSDEELASRRWERIDRAATIASILLFREAKEEIDVQVPIGGIDFAARHTDLPDEALAARLDQNQMRVIARDVRGALYPHEFDRQRMLTALASAHQTYYGTIADAWDIVAEALKYPRPKTFGRRLLRSMRWTDVRGEERSLGGEKSKSRYSKANDLGFALRMLGEFYDRCTRKAQTDNAQERALQSLLRIRFSRVLTAVESVWDVIADEAERSPFAFLYEELPHDERWTRSKGGYRLLEHDLSNSPVTAALGIEMPLKHYLRRSHIN